jgi:segregation and condensation protein B
MQELKNIIESLLFVTDEPLSLEKLKTTLESTDSKEIRQALQLLHEDYEQRGGGFYLREVAGGWQLRSRPQYHEWIRRLLQPSPQRLSKAALETLAIIAYKQPIIRADIEFIRGVDCGGVLRQLMERKLIRVLGRKEIAGRPLIYATTKLFLELFDLKDLKDLPSPKEIAELTNDRSSDSDQGAEVPTEISETVPDPESGLESEPEEMADEVSEGSAVIQDQALDARTEIQSAENERTGDDEILDGDNTLNQDKQVDDKDIQLNNA